MSREQLSLAVREAKRSDEKIHAPGKLGRVRIINQELSVAISSGSTLLSLLAFLRWNKATVEKNLKRIVTKYFRGEREKSSISMREFVDIELQFNLQKEIASAVDHFTKSNST